MCLCDPFGTPGGRCFLDFRCEFFEGCASLVREKFKEAGFDVSAEWPVEKEGDQQ